MLGGGPRWLTGSSIKHIGLTINFFFFTFSTPLIIYPILPLLRAIASSILLCLTLKTERHEGRSGQGRGEERGGGGSRRAGGEECGAPHTRKRNDRHSVCTHQWKWGEVYCCSRFELVVCVRALRVAVCHCTSSNARMVAYDRAHMRPHTRTHIAANRGWYPGERGTSFGGTSKFIKKEKKPTKKEEEK